MGRHKKESTQDAPQTRDTQMKSEMRTINLENEMMKKALAERKKNLEDLKKMKAEEELLIGGQEPDDTDTPHRPYDKSPDGMIERAEAFETTLAEFTDTDGKVEVYKLKDNNYAKIGTFPAKEWGNSLESVAIKFGGGTYKVKLRAPNGSFAGETIVTYDEEAYPKPLPKTVDNSGNNQLEFFRMLQENEEKKSDKFLTMMSTMMSTLAATIGGKTNMLSNMSDLAQFKTLFADKEKHPDAEDKVEKFLNMFQMGMEFGQKNSPADGEPSLMGMIAKILTGDGLPKLTEALKAGMSQPPAAQRPLPRPLTHQSAAPAALAASAAMPVTAEPVAEPPAEEPEQMNLTTRLIIATYRPIIAGYAQKSADPLKTAEMIIDRIPEEYLLIVDDFLKVPTTKELWVFANAPELRQFEQWVDAVMSAMSEVILSLFTVSEKPAVREPKPPKKPVVKKLVSAPAVEPVAVHAEEEKPLT